MYFRLKSNIFILIVRVYICLQPYAYWHYIFYLASVVMPTVEQHLGLVAMTTQPSFMTDLRSVNSNAAVVSQSTQSTAAGQHAPQNLSSSQSSEVQVRGFDYLFLK